MASFGHVAVGMLTGRLHGGAKTSHARRCTWGTLLAFAVLAALPDLDVVAVALGARDAGAIGHRGASHSLFMAVAIGLIAGLLAKRVGWPMLRTTVAVTLAVASHGILDAFGEGGRGIPLLWPFSEARFHSPWRVLPDAPRGLKLLSRPGFIDLALEFAVFFPVTAYALWPQRSAPPRLVVIDGAGATVLARPAVQPATATVPAPVVPVDEGEPPAPARSSG
jgi:inner membrane protein